MKRRHNAGSRSAGIAQLQQIYGGAVEQVQQAMSAIAPILLRACQPVANVFNELNKDVSVSEVTVDVGFGFAAEGNFFIAKGKTNASLSVKHKTWGRAQQAQCIVPLPFANSGGI